MRPLLRFFTVILLAAFLGACGPAAPPDEPTAAPAPETSDTPTPQPGNEVYPPPTEDPYPAPGTETESPYPGPEGGAATPVPDTGPLVVPEPSSASVGNVRGVLLRIEEDGSETPIANAILYLGDVLESDGGMEAMVGVDRSTAPTAVTNSRGEFAFTDVEPARYGLMFDAVTTILLLNDPEDGGNFVIEVTGGEILDIGELAYPLPEI